MADSPPGCSSHCQPLPAELKLYQAYIFSTPILFTLVLLLLFYMLCLRRRRSTWAGSHISDRFFARGFVSAPSERGLDKSLRDMLPTIIFDGSVAAILEDKQESRACRSRDTTLRLESTSPKDMKYSHVTLVQILLNVTLKFPPQVHHVSHFSGECFSVLKGKRAKIEEIVPSPHSLLEKNPIC